MGWSIEAVKWDLQKIFKETKGIRWEVTHPNSQTPKVYVTYDKPITRQTMKRISDLFPDFVYIDFAQVTFPAETQEQKESGQVGGEVKYGLENKGGKTDA